MNAVFYKRFFSCLLCLCMAFSLYAQENNASEKLAKKHEPRAFSQEIRIGAGFYTTPLWIEQLYAEQKENELFITTPPKSHGVYSFGFVGFVNESWSISVMLSLERLSGSIGKMVYDSTLQGKVFKKTDYNVKVIAITPSVTKYWKQSKMLNLYSGAGLGLSFKSFDLTGNVDIDRTEDTYWGLSFQATAIGIRVGNKYAGFAELGFGNMGAVHFGLSAGF